MKIGELASATSTAIETIRFYEREGLLPSPARTAGNFRVYEDERAQRLAFIRHCRSLDMTLEEIRVLLEFKDHPSKSCADVNVLLDEHIGHVAARIKELRVLEKHLKELRLRCGEARSGAECGILNGLSAASGSVPAGRNHVGGTHMRQRGATRA